MCQQGHLLSQSSKSSRSSRPRKRAIANAPVISPRAGVATSKILPPRVLTIIERWQLGQIRVADVGDLSKTSSSPCLQKGHLCVRIASIYRLSKKKHSSSSYILGHKILITLHSHARHTGKCLRPIKSESGLHPTYLSIGQPARVAR